MSDKNYTTLLKRIDLLKNERNLCIDFTNKEDRRILHSYNHYNLINAYKDLFLESTQPEKYTSNANLNEFEAIYVFDKNLRKIILQHILDIEETLKHLITQSFYDYFHQECIKNTQSPYNIDSLHKEDEYLKPLYYDISSLRILGTNKTINRAIVHSNFESEVRVKIDKAKNKSPYIKQYSRKGYYPMWIVMNILTLGNIVNLYDILKYDVKIKMLDKLGLITNLNDTNKNNRIIQEFSELLKILNTYRNLCAHNERLYNYLLPYTQIVDNRFMNLQEVIPSHFNQLTQKFLKRSIFICFYIISVFKSPKQKVDFIREINNEFQNIDTIIDTISINDIKHKMNISFNWESAIMKSMKLNLY
ncbi:Abi family protein [Mammaliicoccus sciuri]|uniref:Abi family protein n=1 Tax=Mammaliicoccus sciuri TaxID=1296 RepID=UPI00133017EA|nr:Abi family protein [Mammaliicoccus sciuri]